MRSVEKGTGSGRKKWRNERSSMRLQDGTREMDQHGHIRGEGGTRPERVRGGKTTGPLHGKDGLRQKESGSTVVATKGAVAATPTANLANDTRHSSGACQKTLETTHFQEFLTCAVAQRPPLIAHRSALWRSPKQMKHPGSYTSSAHFGPWSTRSCLICGEKSRKPDTGSTGSFSTNAGRRRLWCARSLELNTTAADGAHTTPA